jgi:hypothetical protein
MTPADQYRHLAAELHIRANNEPSTHLKAEWDYLAHCYEVLAHQAETNGRFDLGREPILSG